MYQIILSLYDQFHYSLIPDFPLLPVLYVAPQLSWLRMTLVPLMLLFQKKAFFHPPEEAYITELFINQVEGKLIPPDGRLMTVINTVAEKARKELSANSSFPGIFTSVIYFNWLLARQNTTDGLFYDYLPNTFFPLLSLKALEDIANNEEAIILGVLGLYRQDIEFFKPYKNPTAQSTSARPVR